MGRPTRTATRRESPQTLRPDPPTSFGARLLEDARFPPSDAAGRQLPVLSPAERAYMIRKAKEAALALIDHAHTLDGPVSWHYTGKFRGIQMYRGEGSADHQATAGTEFLCGVATMQGSLEEVAAFFDQQTTDRMRSRQADDVLDCGVLYSLLAGEARNPFHRVAVKYQSLEGPSRFSRARDYCFLECQDTFRHASGRRGWVLSMHSIKLPSCPELSGIVRGSMYHSGYVFVEAEKSGYMDVMHSLQLNFKSSSRLPHFLLNAALKRRILTVVQISREIQAARVGRHPLLKKKDLMSKRGRSQCANCQRRFTLFVRKTRCRLCGEVVCQQCAPVMEVDVPGQPLRKTRICSRCYSKSPLEDSDSKDEDEDVRAIPAGLAAGAYAQIRRDENETHYSFMRRDENGTHYSFTRRDENATNYGDGAELSPTAGRRNKDKLGSDEDDDDEEEGEDGLEEQSSCSVFAQSRFTRTSADSMELPDFSSSGVDPMDADVIDEDAIARYSEASSAFWNESTMASTTSWKEKSGVYKSAAEREASSASHFLTAEDTEEELDKRARRYNPTLSIRDYSKEYGRHSRNTSVRPSMPPPPPPPYSPSEEDEDDEYRALSASALREHNERLPQKKRTDGAMRKVLNVASEAATVENDKSAANKSGNGSDSEARRTTASTIADPALRGTTGSAILNQVRANRSRTILFNPESEFRSTDAMLQMEDEHNKRMEDIKRMQAAQRQASESDKMEYQPATRTSSRTSSGPQQGSDPSSGKARSSNSSSRASGEAARSSSNKGSDAGSDSVEGVQEPPKVEAAPKNPKLVSIHSLAARSAPTFAKETIRVSGPPSEHVEDLSFAPEPAVQPQPVFNGLKPKSRSSSDDEEARPAKVNVASVKYEAPSSPVPRESEIEPVKAESKFVETDQVRESEVLLMQGNSVAVHAPISPRESTIALLERASSVRESTMFDEDLINRPTEDIMEQVRANRTNGSGYVSDNEFRSTETMKTLEEEHRQRMAELNRIAVDETGTRISRLLDGDDDDELDEFDLPPPRIKRSGTIPFSPEEVERSTEVMEVMAADHQRRMEELNRIALESVGTRISKFGMEDEKEEEEDPLAVSRISTHPQPRNTGDFDQSDLEFVPTIEEDSTYAEYGSLKETPGSSSSTEQSERPSTPRESTMSDMSQLDMELINRPTEDLMDQVRANRNRKLLNVGDFSASGANGYRSTTAMHDMEAMHRKRMSELNRIAVDTMGYRISKLDVADDDEADERDMAWRNTDMMEQVESDHERKMAALRDKLAQLEFECRESIASVLTAEEIEGLEDEVLEDDAAAAALSKPSNDTSWIGARAAKPSKLIRTTRAMPPRFAEPVSARTLYEQIGELSKLQREMALAQTEGDEEEVRARIKEQYRLLRSIKLRGS